jgi:hypothetical protein
MPAFLVLPVVALPQKRYRRKLIWQLQTSFKMILRSSEDDQA